MLPPAQTFASKLRPLEFRARFCFSD